MEEWEQSQISSITGLLVPEGNDRQTSAADISDRGKHTHEPVFFHCPKCLEFFVDRESCRKHMRNMKCEILKCRLDHDHEFVDLKFSTMTEAMQWKSDQDLNRAFSIRSSGPKRKVFLCRQNSKRNSSRKTCKSKKSTDCSANFTMKEMALCSCDNHESERCFTSNVVIRVRGCIRHSHVLKEKPNGRPSKWTKDREDDLLKSGHRSDVVLAKYCDPTNLDSANKPVTISDKKGMIKAIKLRDSVCRNFKPFSSLDRINCLRATNVDEVSNVEHNTFDQVREEKRGNFQSQNDLTAEYMIKVAEVEKKVQAIKDMIASDNSTHEEKSVLMKAMENFPIQKVQLPKRCSPSSFPNFSDK